MKKVIHTKNYRGVDIALIHWEENKCTPYVVAWSCPKDKIENGIFMGSWGQGHYFTKMINAVEFYLNEYPTDENENEVMCRIFGMED